MLIDNYRIKDLVVNPSKVRIIFVLESPYLNEVVHCHPLAGSSGLDMIKFFKSNGLLSDWDSKIPIGCQIKEKNYEKIGIINCSRYPLDHSVYSCQLNKNIFTIINHLNAIRIKSNIGIDKNIKKVIRTILVKNLKRRVKNFHNQNKTMMFIPCGELARNFLNKCSVDKTSIYREIIPHPSKKQWDKENNFENLGRFVAFLHKEICPEILVSHPKRVSITP